MQRVPCYRLIVSAFAILLGVVAPAVSKAAPDQEEWRTSYVDQLPGEVSRDVRKWQKACGVLKARSAFSNTMEIGGRHYLALHFEQLHCEDRTAICSAWACLHEVYEVRHGRFHKVTSFRTLEMQINFSDGEPVLEADCGLLGCLRKMQWNGNGFTEKQQHSIETEHIFGFTEGADAGRKGEVEVESTFTGRFGHIGRYGVL